MNSGGSAQAEAVDGVVHDSRHRPVLSEGSRVNWKSWDDETFGVARLSNQPIFLSIGFSACRWCQTMVNDTFENQSVSELLNANFTCISVDREQRPDIDTVYQTLHLLLNGWAGGYPLNLILCPQTRLPFASGTFFVPHTNAEQLGFTDWVKRALTFFVAEPTSLRRLIGQVENSVAQVASDMPKIELPGSLCWKEALQGLVTGMDRTEGGFGSRPKFVMPVYLNFLLDSHVEGYLEAEDERDLLNTLNILTERGVRDCLDGGYFRYCLDEGWHQPSFEKMLYDNAQLLEVFCRASEIYGKVRYRQAAEGVVHWIRDRIRSDCGSYWSSLGGDVGGYYQVQWSDVRSCLDARELAVFEALYLDDAIASEQAVTLSRRRSLHEVARLVGLSPGKLADSLEILDNKLRLIRSGSQPPWASIHLLCASNSLLLRALSVGSRVLPQLLDEALSLARSMQQSLWVNNRLFTGVHGGELGRHAMAEDYAYLIDALQQLLQAQWDDDLYAWLVALAESFLRLHEDQENGGFYQTPLDSEVLIYRQKSYMDSILPSSNGIAAKGLLRLARLTGEPRYAQAAVATLSSASVLMSKSPQHHLHLVQAHAEWLRPRPMLIVVDDGHRKTWVSSVKARFGDRVLCYRVPVNSHHLPPLAMHLEAGEALLLLAEESEVVATDLTVLLGWLQRWLEGDATLVSAGFDSRTTVPRENL